MRELTVEELDAVSGAGITEAVAAWGGGALIGAATYGSTWGTVAALTAIGMSPITALAMIGLAFYGGYQIMQD